MSLRPPQTTKTVLGRGLDQLMTGTQTSGQAAAAESSASTIKVNVQVGAGLSTLLRGSEVSPVAARTEMMGGYSRPEFGFNRFILGSSLVAADLLLLGQASVIALRHPSDVGVTQWVLAIVGVGVGAWLGCLAARMFWQENR